MNIRPIKSITAVFIAFAVLILLGISGALSPAAAAGVTINSGLPVTNYPQVTLAFAPPAGAVQMSFMNEESTWSTWETSATSKQWTLSPAAGVKTVWVQFRDAGQAPLPGKFSGAITLDYSIDTSFHNLIDNSYGYQNLGLPGTFNTAANAVAIDSIGRKVVVGTIDRGNGNTDLAVVRYLADGSALDPSFAVGGKYTFGGAYADTGKAVVIQTDGKIVVVGSFDQNGSGDTDILVLRLTSNGVLDDTFRSAPANQGGVVVYTGTGADSANAVAIQEDGKIVVAGTYESGITKKDVIVLRFNTTGTLDTGDGISDTGFGMQIDPLTRTGAFIYGGIYNDAANAVVMQGENIVVVGTYGQNAAGTDSSVWVIRLEENGELDETFGALIGAGPDRKGSIAYGKSGVHTGNAVGVQGANIVVVGTYDWTGGDTDIWVLQLLGDGTLDTGFNGTGSKSFGNPGADSGSAVTVQGSKIIVAGTFYDNIRGHYSVWTSRLNSDGSEDTTFNNGSDYTFGTTGDYFAHAVALQADGRIILAGIGNKTDIPSTLLTIRLHDKTYPLTVTASGSGTVAVFPGILTNGTGDFVPDSIIQITATPVNGATFSGWTNCPAVSGTQGEFCTVTMTSASLPAITANFTQSYALTVSVTGSGTVTSVPAGTISCNSVSGAGCSSTLLDGTVVTLTTAPRPWYTLSGLWGGACSGSITSDCTVTMTQARTVSASFIPNLTARVVGWGDYPTLTEAYGVANASGSSATIQAKNILFPVMSINLPVTVTLQGGKGTDYSAAAVGFTLVTGPFKISNGRLNVSNVKVQP